MANSQKKQQDLERRTEDFSIAVIRIVKKLAKTQENRVISDQLLRSATSIGANYSEANNAASKQDFRAKIFIAKKEAAETRYWLRLLARTNEADFSEELDECQQLLFILQKIITTLKTSK